MNGLINSVSLRIRKDKSEAIDEQVWPQIQASLGGPIADKCPKSDGTLRPRDMNTDPKEISIARSKAGHEMSSPVI